METNKNLNKFKWKRLDYMAKTHKKIIFNFKILSIPLLNVHV